MAVEEAAHRARPQLPDQPSRGQRGQPGTAEIGRAKLPDVQRDVGRLSVRAQSAPPPGPPARSRQRPALAGSNPSLTSSTTSTGEE